MHVFMTLAVFAASAEADEKLDVKFLTGMWTIKYVDGQTEDSVKKSIEFKDDGTFVWLIGRVKKEGTFKLKGTNLELKPKGSKSTTIWKDLSIKDGKLIQPVGKTSYNELTKTDSK